MTWVDGEIAGVVVRPLVRHEDARGWLAELYRSDELAEALLPAMAYVSVTRPGASRGPHAHLHQTDLFGFAGPGTFEVRLWDPRPDSPTRGHRQRFLAGDQQPRVVLVPPGVVHGYRNISSGDGWVFNAPNRLYRGPNRSQPVDEIRYEDDPQSDFRMED